jgi:hypothetical protein
MSEGEKHLSAKRQIAHVLEMHPDVTPHAKSTEVPAIMAGRPIF